MKKYQRRTRSDWQTLITAQLKSNLSAPAFCKEHAISYPSFISWKKKLTQTVDDSGESATFVEITPADGDATPLYPAADPSSPPRASIEIDIGSAMQMRIYTA